MANNYGQLFINKAIQSEDFNAFARYGVNADTFVSKSDREIYEYLERYHEKNGQLPSYAVVADKFDTFIHIPNVTDRFEALAEGLTNRKMAVAFNEYFDKNFAELQKEYDGDMNQLLAHLSNDMQGIRQKYTNNQKVGIDLKGGVDSFISEYKKRQVGESFKTWKSFMPFINDEIGGYSSGNLNVIYAQSGRGKSAIMMREALEIAQQGATVLIWSLEMPAYEVMTRLYTMLSAQLKKTKITLDEGRRSAGFDSRSIRSGQMIGEYERSFIDMLKEINELISGNIIIRAVDDLDFNRRNIAQLQSDIESVNADVVIVDPMYYLDYETNTSKTAGGDAAATSMKLRRLAGSANVVIFAMTQAEEDDKERKVDEIRELKLPSRKAVKKTKSLLEDASTLIAIDTDYTQNRGLVGINKGRNGGEGTSCELTYIPNFGVIEQLKIDENMFDF